MKAFIGIDNGVSGSLAFVSQDSVEVGFSPTPVIHEQSYTKTKKSITRIDFYALEEWLDRWVKHFGNVNYIRVFLERPMVNPKRFDATVSALRSLEATLICIERVGISYEYVDSKQWQRVLLPSGIKGTPELKKASLDIGIRLFPAQEDAIRKHKDADSLLIAEWARRVSLPPGGGGWR